MTWGYVVLYTVRAVLYCAVLYDLQCRKYLQLLRCGSKHLTHKSRAADPSPRIPRDMLVSRRVKQ